MHFIRAHVVRRRVELSALRALTPAASDETDHRGDHAAELSPRRNLRAEVLEAFREARHGRT